MQTKQKIAFGINNEVDLSVEPRKIFNSLGDICNVLRCRNLSSIELRRLLVQNKHRVILHYTVSGYGGTILEPKTKHPAVAYADLQSLIQEGFPVENIVLRIDPIIPSERGFAAVEAVLEVFRTLNIKRCRYKFHLHPKHLLTRQKWVQSTLFIGSPYASEEYGKVFYSASPYHRQQLQNLLNKWRWWYTFETCDKNDVYSSDDATPCISVTDLKILGYKNVKLIHNWQSKDKCHCPIGTIELSTKTGKQCSLQCSHCRHQTDIK